MTRDENGCLTDRDERLTVYDTVNEYLDGILNGEWGSHLEIVALTNLFQIQIQIHSPTGGTTEDEQQPSARSLNIYYSGNNHYEPIIYLDNLPNQYFHYESTDQR